MMQVYAALLRGINVGGKTVKMSALKQLFEASGLKDVQTYIQSGNVLFRSDEDEEILCEGLNSRLTSDFGFTIPVVLRSAEQLERIVINCPFSQEEVSEAETRSGVESLYVALLRDSPGSEKADFFDRYKSESDDYRVIGRDIFLLCRNSIRNSKLANNLQKLDKSATVRNFKTMSKLAQLAGEMKGRPG